MDEQTAPTLAEVLTSALYDNETAEGWYGQAECAEVGRVQAPVLSDWLTARLSSPAVREAVARAMQEAEEAGEGDMLGYPALTDAALAAVVREVQR